VETGAAMTRSDVAEGMSGPRGRTIAGDTYFDRLFVRGARTRQGLEASVPIGSLMLKGEFINMRQQRREQSLRETDLPDLIARGWYASATYPILGKKRNRRGRGFFRSLIPGTSLGLVEAAARYEQIRFGSRGAGGLPPSRSTRAANVPRNSDRAATFGVNWESSRYSRLQFNVIREALEDAVRFPVNGTKMYWTYTGRIQFGF
jgi:phosphate-selective porin